MTSFLKAGVCGAALVLASCGGGGDGSASAPTGNTPPPPVAASATLSGHVTAGAAACDLRLLDSAGAVLATGASDTTGAYNLVFEGTDATKAGSLLRLDAGNCTYVDETTGSVLTEASLSAFKGVPDRLDGAELVLEVTPVTAAMAEVLESADTLSRVALAELDAEVSRQLFGMDGPSISTLTPVVATLPEAAKAGADARLYGLHLAAISGAGDLSDTVEALGDVDWTAERLDESVVEIWLSGAMRFEASGRNLSGERATPAMAYLTSGGAKSGSAPVADSSAGDAREVELGEEVRVELASLFTDADTDAADIMFVVSDLPEGVVREGGTLVGAPTASGTTSVAVVAFDGQGNAARAEFDIVASGGDTPPPPPPPPPPPSVNKAPIAAVSGDFNRAGAAPFTTRFDAGPSSDADGEVVSYAWDLGDGREAEGEAVDVTYSTPGSYSVTLTVTDDDGATDTASLSVAVGQPPNRAPTARITGGARDGAAPFSTTLNGGTSSDADGTVASYSWNLGDGRTLSGKAVSATWDTPGSYMVTLTVTDDDGAIGTASTTVTVAEPPNQAPTAVLNNADRKIELGQSSYFRGPNSSDPDGEIVGWLWDFGDGTTSTKAALSHTYAAAGTYTVTLTVTDDDGATGTATGKATVTEAPNAAPVAKMNSTVRSGTAPFATYFNAGASTDEDGEIVSYAWDLGPLGTRDTQAFNITVDEPGEYDISLTVTDDDGATDTVIGMMSVEPAPVKTVAMPIEVLTGTGTIVKSRTFDIPDASAADRLSLTCHRCDYRDSGVNAEREAKASFRINGNVWRDITDEEATVAYPESAYGGIVGAYHTVRLTLPVTGFVDGENTVEFRFNGTDGFTNGYRIIDLGVLDTAGRELLGDDVLVWDDPTTWTPPRDTADDIRLGGELWNGKVALNESPLSSRKLLATCADCHASDGSDLKYFNYSNETIKVRAMFHGLNDTQGERIASYIRNLDTPNPKQARPWNPPYQPGPGLDSKPVEEWAAGAGLEAVLDHDEDMLDDMFPDGTSNAELRKVTSTRNTINVREQRIALQLPDWKMWLPEVHPLDLWGENWETIHAPDVTFAGIVGELENGGAERMRSDPDAVAATEMITLIDTIGKYKSLVGQSGPQPCKNESVYRSLGYKALIANGFITQPAVGAEKNDGIDFQRPPDIDTNPDACETWQRSVMHWIGVKSWEVHTRFGLEDAAPDLYPYGEARSWLGSERAVFNMASHRSGNDSVHFLHIDRGEASYVSHAWYQLQVILNAGNRNPQNHRPPDWKYQMNWLWANRRDNDVPSTLRYVQTLIKMQQNLDMRPPVDQPGGVPEVGDHYPFLEDRGPEPNGWWTTTHVGPQRFVSIGGSFFNVSENQPRIWSDMDSWNASLRERLQSHLLRAFMDKTLTYDVSEYRRGNGQTNVSGADQIPTPYSGSGRVADSTTDHNQVYRSIPMMREFGMSETQINRLIDWGETMWPLGDWDALRQ